MLAFAPTLAEEPSGTNERPAAANPPGFARGRRSCDLILVLAHHYDAEAEWLCTVLRNHRQAVLLLWPEALGVDYRISLFLSGKAKPAGQVCFFQPPAFTFHGHSARYALNRLGYIQPLTWQHAAQAEKDYATAEINAFFSAFVRALPCPLSNPVRNGALWRGQGFETKWLARLGRQGVALHPLATAPPEAAMAALTAADPGTVRRWLHFEGELYCPPHQRTLHSKLERAIKRERPDEMLEFIAIDHAGSPLLLWVSKTPALSCYGANFIAALIGRAGPARR